MTPSRLNLILKIGLGVAILIAGGVIYLADQQLARVAQETSRLKAETEIQHKQLSIYEKTKSKVESLSYVDDLADKVLPSTPDQSVVVAELSQFAVRSNLSVAQISFTELPATTKKPVKAPGGVTITPLTVQLKAGARYDDLLKFLNQIEQNRRKMQVSDISLSPDAKDRSKLSQVTVVLNLYSKKAGG
jgi:Tfp pilus assembly protein PilO